MLLDYVEGDHGFKIDFPYCMQFFFCKKKILGLGVKISTLIH
jgi:hypothetical protein